MTADSYEEKERLLRRKHELEWENLKARRERAEAKRRGLAFSEIMVASTVPDPFEIEVAELKERQSGELLALVKEKMAKAAEAERKLPDIEPPKIPMTRREFVQKILEEKGWSILDWANEAEVSHATAMDYIQEKTRPYRSTRLKLAKALGVPVDQLPK
jgi:ribosome-binding protein aMBF1 (putative translation factor)